jgi:hypothetical protein
MHIKTHQHDYQSLQHAITLLESPSLAEKLSSLIGSPIDDAVSTLPPDILTTINEVASAALQKAAEVALWSLDNAPGTDASPQLHKLYAAGSGAFGGAFGFTSLLLELPVTTTILMRAIGDIARSEGFDLEDFTTKQACIEVFALGGTRTNDDASDTGYYAIRGFFVEMVSKLSEELAGVAVRQTADKAGKQTGHAASALGADQAAKYLGELIENVAKRFGVAVTDKLAAQAVPLLGAVTGAAINTLFTDYYQDLAKGHFTIQLLEEKYGFEQVKAEYEAIKGRLGRKKALLPK